MDQETIETTNPCIDEKENIFAKQLEIAEKKQSTFQKKLDEFEKKLTRQMSNISQNSEKVGRCVKLVSLKESKEKKEEIKKKCTFTEKLLMMEKAMETFELTDSQEERVKTMKERMKGSKGQKKNEKNRLGCVRVQSQPRAKRNIENALDQTLGQLEKIKQKLRNF